MKKTLLLFLSVISVGILQAQDFKLEKEKAKIDIFKNGILMPIDLAGGCILAQHLAKFSDKIKVLDSKPWRGVARSFIRGSSLGVFLTGFGLVGYHARGLVASLSDLLVIKVIEKEREINRLKTM